MLLLLLMMMTVTLDDDYLEVIALLGPTAAGGVATLLFPHFAVSIPDKNKQPIFRRKSSSF